MVLLLQSLSARLGIVTQRDLAQALARLIRHLSITFFTLAEVAIAACDLC
jgi:manganese transport protein